MRLRALFLDFDGLLCDTERAAYRSWSDLYAEHGLVFPAKVWAGMLGHPDGESLALAELQRRTGRLVGPEVVAARRQRKFELAHREPLRPGVAELLDAAGERGLSLAVVSSSARSWVEPHLIRLGLLDRIPVVVTGDDVPEPKPAPYGYQAALAATGVLAGEVLAFEDSATGVRAARTAGLRCVAVPSAAGVRAGLDAADLVLESLQHHPLDELLSTMDWTVTA